MHRFDAIQILSLFSYWADRRPH